MTRKILITGAGSGLGEGTAVGLARKGYDVIASAQTWPQVTALRAKAEQLKLPSLQVEKLDVLDPYDVKQAIAWEFDILLNNAGIGEGGPIAEIPLDRGHRRSHARRIEAVRHPSADHQSWRLFDRLQ
jgi:NADP-dependent 3-hydroxy acid dehydrogenase YdfG